MKEGIHPGYFDVNVTCSCGFTFSTRSTKKDLAHVEVCSNCHSFYTGKQKSAETGGQASKFRNRFKVSPIIKTPGSAA